MRNKYTKQSQGHLSIICCTKVCILYTTGSAVGSFIPTSPHYLHYDIKTATSHQMIVVASSITILQDYCHHE